MATTRCVGESAQDHDKRTNLLEVRKQALQALKSYSITSASGLHRLDAIELDVLVDEIRAAINRQGTRNGH